MPTKAELAKLIRQQSPAAANIPDDDALVNQYLKVHPEEAKLVTDSGSASKEDNSFSPIAMGLRVVPAMFGSEGGPIGAAFAGAGEGAAQVYEYLTQHKDFRPAQMVAQAGIGAIPFSAAAKELSPMARFLTQGAKGAALGTAATGITKLADGGVPTLKDLATGAVVGGAFGGGAEAAFGRGAQTVAEPIAQVPELAAIQAKRSAGPVEPTLMDRVKNLPSSFVERFQNQLTTPKTVTEDMQKAATGQGFKPGESPYDQTRINFGKMARAEVAHMDLDSVIQDAKKQGLLPDLVQYLDALRVKRGLSRLSDKAEGMLEQSKVAGQDALTAAATSQIEPTTVERGVQQFGSVPPSSQEASGINALTSQRDSLEAAGEALKKRIASGETMPEGLTPDRTDAILHSIGEQLGPDKLQQVQALSDRVHQVARGTLDTLREGGIISDKTYADWASRGDHIGLHRILDENVDTTPFTVSGAPKVTLKSSKLLKAIKGSDKNITDPFTEVLQQRIIAEQEAARNKSVQAFVQFGDSNPAFKGFVERVKGDTVPAGYGTIEGFENGVKQKYAMPKTVADSLNLLNEDNSRILGATLLNGLGRWSQRLVTGANLGFGLVNPIKDVTDKVLLSQEIKSPLDVMKYVGTWAQTLAENLRNPDNPARRAYLNSGAAYSNLQHQITPNMGLGIGKDSIIDRLLSPIENFARATEETSKIASMKLLDAKGVTGPEQVIRVRDFGGSPDFAERGTLSRAGNALVLFFNAHMQGIARDIKGVQQMTTGKLASVLAGATALEMARNEWNNQFVDPDGTPSMDRISQNDRQNYWNFMIPKLQTVDGVQRYMSIKIPKSHAALLLFNPISDVIEKMRQGTGSLAQTALTEAGQFMPGAGNLDAKKPLESALTSSVSALNPVLKVPIEEAWNKETYRNTPIVSKRLEGLPAGMQSNGQTQPVFKTIGEATNTSPLRLQHVLQTLAPGTLGDLATEIGNTAVGKPSGMDLQNGIAGSVTRRFLGSQSDQVLRDMQSTFYDAYGKADELKQAYNVKLKAGDREGAKQILEENRPLFAVHSKLVKVADALAKLRALPPDKAGPKEQQLLQTAMRLLGQPGPRQLSKADLDAAYAKYQESQK